MDTNTRYQTFRLQFIEACLKNTLQNFSKEAILESLNNALVEAFGEGKTIGERTFNEDWKYIKTVLEDHDLTLKKWKVGAIWYYRYSDTDFSINETALTKKEIKRLTDAIVLLKQVKGIDFNNELNDILQKLDVQVKYHASKKGTSVISFQQTEMAKGYEYVDDLYDAIIEQTVIKINYQPFGKESAEKIVSPYHLRQFNNRWFLFGWDNTAERLSNFPLDRFIKPPKVFTGVLYKEPDGIFDAHHYFDNIIGVTKFADTQEEKIVLKVNDKRAPYLITKPLHSSQLHQQLADGSFEITLQVCINNELKQQLLSFGSDIEIISPELLRSFMLSEVTLLHKIYQILI
jgi:predicted DNA-binding transcriptional regulator YafY